MLAMAQRRKTNRVEILPTAIHTYSDTLKAEEAIFSIKETGIHFLHAKLELNSTFIPFELDTVATVTIMSHTLFMQYLTCINPKQHRSGFTNLYGRTTESAMYVKLWFK